MPHFRTVSIGANKQLFKTAVKINSEGKFYSVIPGEYLPAISSAFGYAEISYRNSNDEDDCIKVTVSTYEDLKRKLTLMLQVFTEPTVTSTPMICYNIESHVSFAEDEDGNIYSNAGFEGARWVDTDKYGSHHSSRKAMGGYALVIGAEAVLKTVTKYGDSEEVSYEGYYKGASHLGHENPAQLLNSWCSFRLGDDFKEIPYTDEAALFFHNLMMGMAQLSKQIQQHTFEEQDLLDLIDKGPDVKLLSGPE